MVPLQDPKIMDLRGAKDPFIFVSDQFFWSEIEP